MKEKNKIVSNPLKIMITELVIFYLGAILTSILYLLARLFLKSQDAVVDEFLSSFLENFFMISIILLCLFYMKKTRPETLNVFSKGLFKDRICSGLIGVLIGFVLNAFVSSMIAVTGTGKFSFNGFSVFIILIIPAVFIQCSMEEILCRGFVPEYLKERSHIIRITVGGICFILHHVGNMITYGMNVVFCINVFLLGMFMYLLILVTNNFWTACGFHIAWNYTQQFLFGIPNSGRTSSFVLFQGADLRKNFFFDPTYGNEGSMMVTVCISVAIVILVFIVSKKRGISLLKV